MWIDDIKNSDIIELSDEEFADHVAGLIDAESLAEAMESEEWKDRQEVCQLLGVAPSTLSGWEKDNRIPRHAKVAIGYLVAVNKLKKGIKALKLRSSYPQVVRDGDRWLIISFKNDDDGLRIGQVLAEARTEQSAWLLAGSSRSLHLLNIAADVIHSDIERHSGEYGDISLEKYYTDIKNAIESHLISCDVTEIRRRKAFERDIAPVIDKELEELMSTKGL